MKKVIAAIAVLCIAVNARAQTWDEWFRQKGTQIKYLVEQIAALQSYGSTVKKGYDLVDSGLKDIGHLKKGDLLLHQEHFASLLLVKESVKGSELAARILSLQATMQIFFARYQKRLSREDAFSSAEKTYFSNVLQNVFMESKQIGDEAVLLTTDDQYKMKDEERLQRLQSLYRNMEELFVFVRHFRNTLSVTALNRLKEQTELKKLESLY